MLAFQRCGCYKECFPGCWVGKFGNKADAGARLTEIVVRAVVLVSRSGAEAEASWLVKL
jgi:hypothetical protein